MTSPSYPTPQVVDAAGHPLEVVGDDGQQLILRCVDGTQLSTPASLLQTRDDGTLLLPLLVHGARDAGTLRVPVVQEHLRIDKRTRDSGGVRIRKSVSVHDEQVHVSLAGEQVEIERVPCEVAVQPDNPPTMREEGDTIVIPVLEERLVVSKQLVLKEELRVTRVRSVSTQTHTQSLRSEQVDVVRADPVEPEKPSDPK